MPRWSLLAGKFLGVLVFVAAQNALFVGGTWLALGVRTSVWDPTYFLCIPMLLLHFAVFFSSCFLGAKKPDEAIFRMALQLTQRVPEECVFIDDRELNVECARHFVGMRAIHYQDPDQLVRELADLVSARI